MNTHLLIALLFSSHTIADVSNSIWLAQSTANSPEIGMWFLPNGNFRGCVWLDEERVQTDFGTWKLQGRQLLVQMDGDGTAEFLVEKHDAKSLNLSISGSQIHLKAANESTHNRCLPIFEVWGKLAQNSLGES